MCFRTARNETLQNHQKSRQKPRISTFLNYDEPFPTYQEEGYAYKCSSAVGRLFRSCVDFIKSLKWRLESCLESLESCLQPCLNMCGSWFSSIRSGFATTFRQTDQPIPVSENINDYQSKEVYSEPLSSKAKSSKKSKKKRKKEYATTKSNKNSFRPRVLKNDNKRRPRRKLSPSAGLTITKQPLKQIIDRKRQEIMALSPSAASSNAKKESRSYESIPDPSSYSTTQNSDCSNLPQSYSQHKGERFDITFVPESSYSSRLNYESQSPATSATTSMNFKHENSRNFSFHARTSSVEQVQQKNETHSILTKPKKLKATARLSQEKPASEILQSVVNSFFHSDDGASTMEENYCENFWAKPS